MRRDFTRVAIVNRGEAAMRFVHAARELACEGLPLHSIALFTDPDRYALFVRGADESHSLGPAMVVDPSDGHRRSAYLDYGTLERALAATGADAVWVGWGFVAEHAAFADLCAKLGLVFIGPGGDVMRRLGDKITSKTLAEQAQVPVVPWSGGPVPDLAAARGHAERLGFPLMIKATAGGGGRGIRLVSTEPELAEAFHSARAEALKAFGDATVFLERCVRGARHVEVQVMADAHGTTWALGVRDCTIQRRNQKMVEESPSPALSPALDADLRAAAVRLSRAAGYQNAGTVEFLFDAEAGQCWFMEVNARLQVEHPVTELTTGLDLVKLQVKIARGERLEGDPPAQRGHAIEARLNAEDPDNGFAPAPGLVQTLRLPGGPGLRVDTGVSEGDVIPQEFDSMIAKVVAWGHDRTEALARLRRALGQTAVVVKPGTTNKAFLLELLARPEVAASDYDVGWLDRVVARGELGSRRLADVALLRAAVEAYDEELDVERAQFLLTSARGRPEVSRDVGRSVELRYRGHTYRLGVWRLSTDRYRVEAGGTRADVAVERLGHAPLHERRGVGSEWRLQCAGASHRVTLVTQGLSYLVEVDGVAHRVSRDAAGTVRATAPALVVSVHVREGDEVETGDRLLVLEAMKMELAVTAPCAGRVREVHAGPNVQVASGAPLVLIEPLGASTSGADAERVTFERLAASPEALGLPVRRARVLEELRALVLGYDVDATALSRAMAEWKAVCAGDQTDEDPATLECESRVLGLFVDICSLVHADPGGTELEDPAHVGIEEYLFTYLRTLDASGNRLPAGFVAKLQQTLAHYGVAGLERTTLLEESLFRVFKARERGDEAVAPVLSILERRLARSRGLAPRLGDDFRGLLDRMVAATQRRFPSVNDLAREVRYRYFEQPLLERARTQVYGQARAHLAALSVDPQAPGRLAHVAALVECPQPLASFLMSRFGEATDELRQVMLEVLTRRYYRIRELENVRAVDVDGQLFTTLEYSHEGRRVHAVTTHAPFDRFAETVRRAEPLLMGFPRPHDVALDLYLWCDGALDDVDANEARLRAALEAAAPARPLRHVVVAVSGPQAGLGMAGMQHFTYRPAPGGAYQEQRFYRGAHPMLGKRLEMWRLANFDIERLPSTEDLYLIHGVARDNPRDERLFAVAEVRDLTPVVDAGGRVVQLPELERMLMEALNGLRHFQSKRPTERRLQWNQVLLYVWPPFDLKSDELSDLVNRVAPSAEGLGIEEIYLRARVPDRGTGQLRDTIIAIGDPGAVRTLSYRDLPTEPINPLSAYEQKVVRSRQQGLQYPYELLRRLTPPRTGSSGNGHGLPPGEFFEHDLDEHHRLVPVDRPPGENTANVVVAVVRNFTRKYPEGIARVVLLGDPSRDLGALAEPECRRIIAAIDLAEQKQVALEWYALSAGAKISMDSGTENMDWIALVLRRLVNFTQRGGEVNIVVNGINVGAQPYWNAESTMLMHTRGVLIMMPDSAMVLTGKRALDYSGGVSAEDNQGIGGVERVMGPNGQAQYFARDISEACRLLLRHYDHTHVAPGEIFPRRAATTDPIDRDVRSYPYGPDHRGFGSVGEIFSDQRNPGRKKPFDIRRVMAAAVDQDLAPLERWARWRDAENAVVWDCHLGGYPVTLVGIESRPLQRMGFVPADGPDQWTAGTLFPQSSRKLARAINAASGNRPVVLLANLSGFDGSPESLRLWQLEYGAEIGRAVVNFRGPMVFCVISRYHGGAFVVFSNALNPSLEVAALEGTYASVIGGAPAAAVVFARDVEKRTNDDPAVQAIEREIAAAGGVERARLRARAAELRRAVRATKLGEIADEFDRVHSVHRAQRAGSVHHIIPPARLRPYLVEAVERGIKRELARRGRER